MANRRKAKEELIAAGTFRKDRHEKQNEGSFEWRKLNAIPEAPEYFDDYAKDIWNLITKELFDRNDLCEVYLTQLEQYAYSSSLAQRAAKELNTTLTTASKANPAVSPYFRVYSQAVKTVMDIGDKFCFNVKSKLSMPPSTGRQGDEHDKPDWNPDAMRHLFDMNDPEQKAEYEAMCKDFHERYPNYYLR